MAGADRRRRWQTRCSITSSASGSSGARVTIATPASLSPAVRPRRATAAGGDAVGCAPARSGLRNGPSRCKPSERAAAAAFGRHRPIASIACAMSSADDEITVGMNDVTPHCTRYAATSPMRSGCDREVDADCAVDLQVDEAGQHRAARCVDDSIGRLVDRPRRRLRSRAPSTAHVDACRRGSRVTSWQQHGPRRVRRAHGTDRAERHRRIDHPHPRAEVERTEELGLLGIRRRADRRSHRGARRRAMPRRR